MKKSGSVIIKTITSFIKLRVKILKKTVFKLPVFSFSVSSEPLQKVLQSIPH